MSKDLVVSIIIRAHNEADSIGPFLKRVETIAETNYRNYEIIVVDDGSTDDTVDTVRRIAEARHNIRLICLTKSFGRQIAFTAGLDNAIGDFVILLPTDISIAPDLIPEFVARAQEGFDSVTLGWNEETDKQPFLYRLSSSVFYRLNKYLTGVEIDKRATDFRVVSRRLVNAITQLREHSRFLRMMFQHVGYKSTIVFMDRPQEPGGRPPVRYGKKILLAIDALIAFSARPLRLTALGSLVLSLLALVGACVVVGDQLIRGAAVEGWTSLMVVLLTMFCMLFLVLAVMSEYIYRILEESQNRPLYYVRGEFGGTKIDIEDMVDVH